MKKITFLFLIFCRTMVLAQSPADSVTIMEARARALMDHSNPFYNPSQSFNIYMKLATQGNAEAMNGLGIMLSKGIGVTINDVEALKWYEKAAKGGYGNAWYNLGTMIKNGVGAPQDFVKAYECYKQGAAIGNGIAYYGQGFMLYKGLGCTQSYEQAFSLFTKSAAMNCLGSMYMMGLCYRNGYGISVNLDSARYWLNKASKAGYRYATDELASSEPENVNISNPVVAAPVAVSQQTTVSDIKAGNQKVNHHLPKDSISGEYTGYALKFDWSGRHIISESALSLKLSLKGKTLRGIWTEDNNISTPIEAQLTDTALVFNNTQYSRPDHYNTTVPNDFEFKNAKLQLVKNADTVYITGNLQLFSTKLKEPEKPTFIMLIRNDKNLQRNIANADTLSDKNGLENNKTDSVKLVIYPNPFINILNAHFTLKKACTVRLIVSNLTDARIIYKGPSEQLAAGEYNMPLQINALPGTYVCTLNFGNKVKSAIVFKQ